MLFKNCATNQKNFVEKYKNYIHNQLNGNYDDFIISLNDSEIIDTNGNIDYEKVRFYGEKYFDELYNFIVKENIDIDVFMGNAILYYNLQEYTSLLAMVSAYYEMVRGRLPLHILQFAINSTLLQCFLQTFTDVCKCKISYAPAK